MASFAKSSSSSGSFSQTISKCPCKMSVSYFSWPGEASFRIEHSVRRPQRNPAPLLGKISNKAKALRSFPNRVGSFQIFSKKRKRPFSVRRRKCSPLRISSFGITCLPTSQYPALIKISFSKCNPAVCSSLPAVPHKRGAALSQIGLCI